MTTFGDFIAKKRKEKRITLKSMSEKLGITAPYLSDVEKGNRDSFYLKKLEKIAKVLEMTSEDKATMMDLAGKQREEIAPDLPEYILKTPAASVALRKAKDMDVGEEEWIKFTEQLEKGEE